MEGESNKKVERFANRMRPIYHWKTKSEAHVAIRFLTYSLSYTMKYRIQDGAKRNFSIQKMRKILKRDQYSLIEDKDKNLYRMPSRQTEPIKAIYEAFGLKRVFELTVLSQLN